MERRRKGRRAQDPPLNKRIKAANSPHPSSERRVPPILVDMAVYTTLKESFTLFLP